MRTRGAWFRGPLITLLLASAQGARAQRFPLPPHPKPDLFGNLLISRTTASGKVRPATFSHWSHRQRHTCRVCHLELEFGTRVNSTPITEKANQMGQFCGACHDGRTAFGHTQEHCLKCHTGSVESGRSAFSKLKGLPRSKFGNGIDWVAALGSGKVKPATALQPGQNPVSLATTLTLEAEFSGIPPAVFPHAAHSAWLDCANCHPDPFIIKKKATQHFSMQAILDGQFCGVCHLHVAFPMDDCKRCHPGMSG